MNPTEASSNIIVAMINNGYICTPEDIAEAYKIIYTAVNYPEGNY